MTILRLEKMHVDIYVCHLHISRKVSSRETKAANESEKRHGCLKNAKAPVACINNCTKDDAEYVFLHSVVLSSQTFAKKGSFRFLPSFMLKGFFPSQLDVNCHHFTVVTLSSAVKVQDRWKESIVVCKYKVCLWCVSAFLLRYL